MRLARPLLLACAMACSAQAPAAQRVLRVCADPNNLPFSNAAGDGFENRIVAVLARELGARVEYTWWAQRRGFLRNTLNAGTCDVVAGLASGMEGVRTTRPVYRSTYVFVTRATLAPPLSSLDDPRLATLKLGVQLVGDDGANTPPAHALARRGLDRGEEQVGDEAERGPGHHLQDDGTDQCPGGQVRHRRPDLPGHGQRERDREHRLHRAGHGPGRERRADQEPGCGTHRAEQQPEQRRHRQLDAHLRYPEASSWGSCSNSCWVKLIIVASIQLPLISSAIPTPISFGTKESVTSWIIVTDWNSETANPMTSAVSRMGAHSLAATIIDCNPIDITSVSVMAVTT
jgi:hypothetical protein